MERKCGYRSEIQYGSVVQCPNCGSIDTDIIGGVAAMHDGDDLDYKRCNDCHCKWEERSDGFFKIVQTKTPYEEASEWMKKDTSLKHVVYSWQMKCDKEETCHGIFRFKDDVSFEAFVNAVYAAGATYIGAIHR